MRFGGFILLLIIAGIVGGIAQAILGISGRGCLVSVAIGLIGGLLGNLFANIANLPDLITIHIGDSTFPLVWSVIGAVLFVSILSLLTGKFKH